MPDPTEILSGEQIEEMRNDIYAGKISLVDELINSHRAIQKERDEVRKQLEEHGKAVTHYFNRTCQLERERDAALARVGDGWIAASDKLPEDAGHKGHVLVARELPYDPQFGDRDVTMGYLSKSGWRDDHGSIQKYGETITHWRPLPSPPSPAEPTGEMK